MISLVSIWRAARADNLKRQEDEFYEQQTASNFMNQFLNVDGQFIQNSFTVPPQTRVVFLKSTSPLRVAMNYEELPKLHLSAEDAEIVAARAAVLESDVRRKNSNHLLIRDIYYVPEKKLLAVDAVGVSLAFLDALEAKLFSIDSDLYDLTLFQPTLMTPLITTDNHICLMQRSDAFGLVSTPTSLLDPDLSPISAQSRSAPDLVERTASKVAKDKVLGDCRTTGLRATHDDAELISVSFRQNTQTGLASIDFVAPIRVHTSNKDLDHIISTNCATDAGEYTGRLKFVPLDPQLRAETSAFFSRGSSGKFLHDPAILAASEVFARDFRNFAGSHNSHLPGSRTVAYPVSALVEKPKRTITWEKDRRAAHSRQRRNALTPTDRRGAQRNTTVDSGVESLIELVAKLTL